MTAKMLYFDNAATSYPKPEAVYIAQDEYSRQAGNPGRGAYRLSMQSARTIHESRLALAELLGIKQVERLVFTPGCTYSINMALKGMSWQPGDTVMVGPLEHNAVMRPLRQLEREIGIKVHVLPYSSKGVINLHGLIEGMLKQHPKLVLVSESSNVTGESIDLRSIAAICGAHKVTLMVDAAQSAGRSEHNIEELGIGIWCSSGHKGLYGLPGVGLLYVAPTVQIDPLVVGSTGFRSADLLMPEQYPEHLEPGTLAGPAIAALGAAAKWLREAGVQKVGAHEAALTKQFLTWAEQTPSVQVFGNRSAGGGAPVVAFSLSTVSADRVAQRLEDEYGIAVRSGLHCSPAAHTVFDTLESGLVRASFGYFNTSADVAALCQALHSIAEREGAAGS